MKYAVIANTVTQKNRHCEERSDVAIHEFSDLDCHASLSMNSPVIANEVKQSMTSNCLDCRATLAVTQKKPSLRGT